MAESQALIDALPYSDEGYEDEQVREAAARLIEEEVRLYVTKVHRYSLNILLYEIEIDMLNKLVIVGYGKNLLRFFKSNTASRIFEISCFVF